MRRALNRSHPEATLADWQEHMRKHQDELSKFGEKWVRYQMSGAADAIKYLVDRGARSINLSDGMQKDLCECTEVWEKIEQAFAYAAANNDFFFPASVVQKRSAHRNEDHHRTICFVIHIVSYRHVAKW
jgi:hypothetical protein